MVLESVAKNAKTPIPMLIKLSQLNSKDINFALIDNENLPYGSLKGFLLNLRDMLFKYLCFKKQKNFSSRYSIFI